MKKERAIELFGHHYELARTEVYTASMRQYQFKSPTHTLYPVFYEVLGIEPWNHISTPTIEQLGESLNFPSSRKNLNRSNKAFLKSAFNQQEFGVLRRVFERARISTGIGTTAAAYRRVFNEIADLYKNPKLIVDDLPDELPVIEPYPIGTKLFNIFSDRSFIGYGIKELKVTGLDIVIQFENKEHIYMPLYVYGKKSNDLPATVRHDEIHQRPELETKFTTDFNVALEIVALLNQSKENRSRRERLYNEGIKNGGQIKNLPHHPEIYIG